MANRSWTARNPDNPLLKAALLTVSTLAVLASVSLSPALPAIKAQFAGLPNIDLWARLVLTLPALTIAASAPLAGYLIDRYGRKRLLIVSTLLYGLAGTAGLYVPNLGWLLASRALLGFTVGGTMTTATTLIADYYIGQERARFMGLQVGFMGLAGVLYLTLAGVLADLGWRQPFLVYFIALAIVPLIIIVVYEPPRCAPEQDIAGPLGEPSDCAAQAIRASEAKAGPPAEPAPEGPTPIRLMILIYSLVLLSQVMFYLVPVHFPFYVADLYGANGAQSGLAISIMSLFFALASMAYGWLRRRLDRITILAAGFGVFGLGYVLISTAAGQGVLVVGLILGGAGLGTMMPNFTVWLADISPLPLRGRALGLFTTSSFLGKFLSPVVTQPLVNAAGLNTTYLVAGLLALALVPLFLFAGHSLRPAPAQPV